MNINKYSGLQISGSVEARRVGNVYEDLCKDRAVDVEALGAALINTPIYKRAPDGLSAEVAYIVSQWENDRITVCDKIDHHAHLLRIFDFPEGRHHTPTEAFDFLGRTIGDNAEIMRRHADIADVPHDVIGLSNFIVPEMTTTAHLSDLQKAMASDANEREQELNLQARKGKK